MSCTKPYLPLYKKALYYLKDVPPDNAIVELGCGLGHLAKLLFDRGHRAYVGIDFSEAVLKKARERIPNGHFILVDVHNYEIDKSFRTFVLLELLEHVTDDQKIIASIPLGSKVVLSVPNYDSKTHVRWFEDRKAVIDCYSKWLEFGAACTLKLSKRNRLFIFDTIRRDRK